MKWHVSTTLLLNKTNKKIKEVTLSHTTLYTLHSTKSTIENVDPKNVDTKLQHQSN